jgi:pentatricopeptide repeat protein
MGIVFKDGYQPKTAQQYNAAIKMSDVDKFDDILKEMIENGIKPTSSTLLAILRKADEHKSYEEAQEILQRFKEIGLYLFFTTSQKIRCGNLVSRIVFQASNDSKRSVCA